MVRRATKNYSSELKEQALTAYFSNDEPAPSVALRFGINKETFCNWVYRRNNLSTSPKIATLPASNSNSMKKEELSEDAMREYIKTLEESLSNEKMRSESLSKMIEIAEHEFQINIRKNSGAKRSTK